MKVFTHVNEVFPLLLSTLAHESDEVVIADLYVFAEIAASKVPAGNYFIFCCVKCFIGFRYKVTFFDNSFFADHLLCLCYCDSKTLLL